MTKQQILEIYGKSVYQIRLDVAVSTYTASFQVPAGAKPQMSAGDLADLAKFAFVIADTFVAELEKQAKIP
jgi:hypothetical protein